MAEPEPVGVGDLEVADRIARAVRRGKPADARPTLEQVLFAFGEPEPTLDARRRAARALALAGVATTPDLLEVAPGDRVILEVRQPKRRGTLLLGIVALVAVLAGAAALASTLDTSSTEGGVDLPPGTGSDTAPTTSTPTASTPTTSTPTASTPTTSTPSTTPKRTAAQKQREQRLRERRARERRERAARAAARRRVTVRLNASQPTFLCVEGDGRQLYNGTLTRAQTFRARVVRLNVGLGPTTRVTANGKAVPLTSSPTGVQITPKGQTFLPLGSRPCA